MMYKIDRKSYTGRNATKVWSCGLYLRLSREDGDKHESDSISSQKDMLLAFVDQHTDLKVYDIYIDDGWSGASFNRPGFKAMEEDLRAKKIDCIIVKDLSRFGRNSIEIGNYLTILFPYLKTRFICVNDNVDSYLDPDSLDNLSTKFKNLINDEYCRDLSIKIKSTLTMQRECGKFIGSFACYGYKKDPNDCHKIIIDEEVAPIVRKIGMLFLGGESIRGIVRILNEGGIYPPAVYKKMKFPSYNPAGVTSRTVWSMRTVRRILVNRMYVGDMVQNVMNNISYRIQKCRAVDKEDYIVVKDTHEAIFSRAEFAQIENLLSRDTRESPNEQRLNVLSGFIKCGDCKRGMMRSKIHSGYKDYLYYFCTTFKNRGKHLCTKHSIRAEKVERVILEFIKFNVELALEIEPILQFINQIPTRVSTSKRAQAILEQYKTELSKTYKLKEDLYPDYKEGIIEKEEYESFRQKYIARIFELEEKIPMIEAKIDEINRGISSENKFIQAFKQYHTITDLSRGVVCALIENIYVYEDDRIEIVMKYKDEYDTIVEYIANNRLLIQTNTNLQVKAINQILPNAINGGGI